jgi:hypothetical protein
VIFFQKLKKQTFLDRKLERKWIGRGIPISFPLRLPDLTPFDFFFWWHIEDNVDVSPIARHFAGTCWEETSCCL